MGTMVVIYAIYAAGVLVWCSSGRMSHGLHNSLISREVLDQWIASGDHPVIFDLYSKLERPLGCAAIPGSVVVTLEELSALIPWIPPHSILVFHSNDGIRSFDREMENRLLSSGVVNIFWLCDGLDSHAAVKPEKGFLHRSFGG
jgi:hypothetical protein